jgi:hypothetical protein
MIVFKDELNAIITMLSWLAPTENVDGSAIDYELNYVLYVNGTACLTVQVTEYQLAALSCIAGPGQYQLAVSAYPRHVDLATNPEVESDLSNTITIKAEEVKRPKAPADLSGA